jgi:hypothetical protein
MTICDDGIDLAIYEHNLGNLFLSGACTENAIYRHLGDTISWRKLLQSIRQFRRHCLILSEVIL